ncbi:hypothetical protein [Melittangium boletus]|uniref:Uncharacterized protein n=1 Tax=Melittangium boletus DSM 14713 TaxID=1294270 RepID=A0A250IBN9_9BACT|nr:hypothetical protein [Melittangium boletus]ATB29259.1 hypothetical protein MEBOL_002708 [Melittangium boletus DSM 14713]
MPRLPSLSTPKLTAPSLSTPRSPTAPQRPISNRPTPAQNPVQSTPRGPGRDSFEPRSGGPSTSQPRTSPPPADNDGWETVSSKKKPSGPKTFDPDRRFNQSLTEIDNKLSSSAAGKGDMYGTVNVQKSDLSRLHGDLRNRYHGQQVPGYPNERYYVTNQSAQRKGGGFNITSHEFNKNGVDTTIRDSTKTRFNIHILPQ